MKQTIAVFDFDETLGIGISGLRFFRYFLGKKRFYYFMLHTSFWHFLFVMQWGEQYALNKIFALLLKGQTVAEVTRTAEQFSKEIIPQYLYGKVLQRLKWHQEQEHQIIIISGSLDIYLRPWAEQIKATTLIATKLETTEEGYFTGKIEDQYYSGKAKLRALLELIGQLNNFVCYAYGNSVSDRYILAAADYAYWIRNPEEDIDKALIDPQTQAKWVKNFSI